MICSAMFYKTEDDVERPTIIEIGPFNVTMQELYVACVSAAIVFPATLFVTLIFRNAHSKQRQTYSKDKASSVMQFHSEHIDEYDDDDIDRLIGQGYKESGITTTNEQRQEQTPTRKQQLRNNWLLILAWTVANLAVFLSAFFVILYSMQWGSDRSNAWLVAFLISLLENILLADPVKVNLLKLYKWFKGSGTCMTICKTI